MSYSKQQDASLWLLTPRRSTGLSDQSHSYSCFPTQVNMLKKYSVRPVLYSLPHTHNTYHTMPSEYQLLMILEGQDRITED